MAPDFTLPSLINGEEYSLHDYKGKPVLLTFWVSWCPDSKKDLSAKNHLFASMNSDLLAILTVNVTGREHGENSGESYYREQKYTIPALKDDGTRVYDMFQCMSVPTTFLLNENHEIVARFNDKATFQDILTEVSKII
ncbi:MULTISPECIES: TlpA family protein disulfide reductase [Bacillaceae]|uniref:TlpA family protein disulfide reductase n=1 Tax=Evansella alkalicola TaxID=745819 RepID=A0ABS6K0C4_9BACI|nr:MULTISPECIES: TlpA disulfide reductase family protein [Bacillaceae]MBU9723892.1 TlpA family protein disulfide reductase [Bacillus alkalicola]